MTTKRVVSRDEWLVAREQHLLREKELTRMRDEVARERRALPWVRVDKRYVFHGPAGEQTLAELFAGRSQLIVQHFMFAPGWTEGCVGCSFLADHVDAARAHFEHHDVSFVAVSRAPWPEFQAFQRRMGWRFPWVSSHGSDFNYDFGVSFTPEQVARGEVYYNYAWTEPHGEELHGTSVFYKDAGGELFHTYSTYARGPDLLLGAYNFLDLTPKGRDEQEVMDWVRHRDRYEGAPARPSCCGGDA